MQRVLRNLIVISAVLLIPGLACLESLAGSTGDDTPLIFAAYMRLGADVDPSSVRIYLDGEDVTDLADVTQVRVSFRPIAPLRLGEHSVRVTVGKGKEVSQKRWTFTVISNEVGDIDIFLPKRLKIVFHPIRTPSAEPLQTIQGITLPGADVELFVNGMPFATGIAGANGQFKFPLVPLSEGSNEISAIASLSDPVETGSLHYLRPAPFVDTTTPSVRIVHPKPGARLAWGGVRVRARIEDDGVGVQPGGISVFVDGRDQSRQAVVDAGTLTYHPDGTLPPGRHEVSIEARDRVGNLSPPALTWFVLEEPPVDDPDVGDTSDEGEDQADDPDSDQADTGDDPSDGDTDVEPEPGPVAPSILSPFPRSALKSPLVDVKGEATPLHMLRLFVNGKPSLSTNAQASGAFAFQGARLKTGMNRLMVEDDDPGLAQPLRSETVMVMVVDAKEPAPPGDDPDEEPDPVKPVITRPEDGKLVHQAWVELGGEAGADDEVTAFVNGQSRASTRANPAGKFNIPKLPLEPGENVIYVEAVDALGLRTASDTITVRYGAQAMQAAMIAGPRVFTPIRTSGPAGNRADVRGLAPGVRAVRLLVNGLPVRETPVTKNGRFSFSAVALEPGLNELVVETLSESGLSLQASRPMLVRSPARSRPLQAGSRGRPKDTGPDQGREP